MISCVKFPVLSQLVLDLSSELLVAVYEEGYEFGVFSGKFRSFFACSIYYAVAFLHLCSNLQWLKKIFGKSIILVF